MDPPNPGRNQLSEGAKTTQNRETRQPLINLSDGDMGAAGFILILLLANMLSGERPALVVTI